jgi:hypothetical protein
MKESADYQFLKALSNKNDYIQYIRNLNCFNEVEKFKLDSLSLNKLLSIIEIDINKSTKYIEQRYLINKFNEDKLVQILCKLLYPHPHNDWINKVAYMWEASIKYFENLPLYVYFKAIQSNINIFENISEDTKNYNEIKEYYRFLKL